MKTKSLMVRIEPDYKYSTRGSYHCVVEFESFANKYTVEVGFPEDDLESIFDMIFEDAKARIKEALREEDKRQARENQWRTKNQT